MLTVKMFNEAQLEGEALSLQRRCGRQDMFRSLGATMARGVDEDERTGGDRSRRGRAYACWIEARVGQEARSLREHMQEVGIQRVVDRHMASEGGDATSFPVI